MKSKYCNYIEKIQNTEQFKKTLIEKMMEAAEEETEENHLYDNKTEVKFNFDIKKSYFLPYGAMTLVASVMILLAIGYIFNNLSGESLTTEKGTNKVSQKNQNQENNLSGSKEQNKTQTPVTATLEPTVTVEPTLGPLLKAGSDTSTDFYLKMDQSEECDNYKVTLISASKEWNELTIRFSIETDQDISGLSEFQEDMGYRTSSVFESSAFEGSYMMLNDDKNQRESSTSNGEYIEYTDVELTSHKLVEEIEISLSSEGPMFDMRFALFIGDIILPKSTLKGGVKVEGAVSDSQLNYIETMDYEPLDYKGTSAQNQCEFTIFGYRLNEGGLKVLGKESGESRVNFLMGEDDLGNKYLFYPKHFDGTKVYTIYKNGPGDSNNDFKDFLDPNASSISLALYEEEDISFSEIQKMQDEMGEAAYDATKYERVLPITDVFTIPLR